jgi:ABC-2 type transport system permease protein
VRPGHALTALWAIVLREFRRFFQQKGRLAAVLVRPLLWLLIFAAGFQSVFGVSIIPPYKTYITYQVYVLPGLAGMMLLFNGMQSSLSLVYDREMGMMRLLLTAPLPRWFLLFSKLLGGIALSILQVMVFLAVARAVGIKLPVWGYVTIVPALALAALMLGSLGLLLSVYIRQLENFAGTMNFVIFPMFFLSSALYPLWKLKEAASPIVWWAATLNPFTYAVETIRFAAYGMIAWSAIGIVAGCAAAFFLAAVWGYDPGRGLIRQLRPASV